MKNGWTLLVVGSLFLAAGVGRSEEDGAVKCLTLQQRLQEWAKLRVVSGTAAEPVEPAPPVAPEPPPAPPPLPAAAVSRAVPPGPPCMSGPGHRPFCDQLRDWLTYRPLSRCWCGCLPKCAQCCPPPLYTSFMGPCCVDTTGAGCRPACGHGGYCGCCPGNDRFHLWTPSRGLLFWRE